MDTLLLGLGASAATWLATAVGALPILLVARPSVARQNLLLGFAAGVMLAAAFFSLIIPGLEQARSLGATRAAAGGTMVAAVLLGGLSLSAINRLLPIKQMAALGPRAASPEAMRRIWLFVAAITLHNVPEGMAVGIGFAGGDLATGLSTAVGIGLQNLPEGLAVAATLTSVGTTRRASFGVAAASGLVEPLGGLIGAGAVSLSAALLPWGLGFAAGAMIYIVAAEIIPATQRDTPSGWAAHGLMVGLAAMMFLDVTLG